VWAELEALSALQTFAYLNPDYTRPQLEADGMTFTTVALGHPLIDHEERVCNDFQMDTQQVTMLTGSNMSGKSSFLRTLGINLVLANAGAVVNAKSLHTSLFRVYSCIKVSDSLAEGYSYFYAEVRRLKALLNALERPDSLPLFFLIDEIFKGTNNRERLLGSEAYIHALLGKNGTGAISTHDLELASLTGLSNYHFADQVLDGQLTFDYKLRVGVSPTTNALRIMRLAGLPVGED
ncbi:MAG: DNA mismatch repair protein MutS, partial [Chloroflexota bacterium]